MHQKRDLERLKSIPKQQEKAKKKEVQKPQTGLVCPKCGAKNESTSLFCEECGSGLTSSKCPKCNAELLPGADICEKCGTYLNKTKCAYCAADIGENEEFCPECGNPVSGIKCPQCGEISQANFCVKCNTPLTDIAREELQKAMADPKYQEVVSLFEEIKQLQDENLNLNEDLSEQLDFDSNNQSQDQQKNNTDFDLNQSYLDYINQGLKEEPEKKLRPPSSIPKSKPKPIFDLSRRNKIKEEINKRSQEIENKRRQIQEKLDEMSNQSFPSPQTARTYFSARKPPIENLVWNCRFNNSIHPDPQNCGQPQHGGKWIIVEGDIEWQVHYGDM
jgi:hypothetical protein